MCAKPVTIRFAPSQLATELQAIAEKRQRDWIWDGLTYESRSRPNLQGLKLHAEPLEILLHLPLLCEDKVSQRLARTPQAPLPPLGRDWI